MKTKAGGKKMLWWMDLDLSLNWRYQTSLYIATAEKEVRRPVTIEQNGLHLCHLHRIIYLKHAYALPTYTLFTCPSSPLLIPFAVVGYVILASWVF